mmetsp:Transcript_19770/g.69971  ORF Transcript_19770/g.69971 Transcript_19770/m.69971 type:complete len:213 (-) Transcript_19770:134-772(-)
MDDSALTVAAMLYGNCVLSGCFQLDHHIVDRVHGHGSHHAAAVPVVQDGRPRAIGWRFAVNVALLQNVRYADLVDLVRRCHNYLPVVRVVLEEACAWERARVQTDGASPVARRQVAGPDDARGGRHREERQVAVGVQGEVDEGLCGEAVGRGIPYVRARSIIRVIGLLDLVVAGEDDALRVVVRDGMRGGQKRTGRGESEESDEFAPPPHRQ